MDSPHNRETCEYRLIYAVLAAGKPEKFADSAMQRLIAELEKRDLAVIRVKGKNRVFQWFKSLRAACRSGQLLSCLEAAQAGNSFKNAKIIGAAVNMNLVPQTVELEELMRIQGMGPRTARFYLRWTDRQLRYAVLDVHILGWLRNLGHDVPDQTPPNGKRYDDVEQIFLSEADKRGVHPADLDKHLWSLFMNSGAK